jgi:hypothetical protein
LQSNVPLFNLATFTLLNQQQAARNHEDRQGYHNMLIDTTKHCANEAVKSFYQTIIFDPARDTTGSNRSRLRRCVCACHCHWHVTVYDTARGLAPQPAQGSAKAGP